MTTEYAKNYCNRTLVVQVIVEHVVSHSHVFILRHSVLWACDRQTDERTDGRNFTIHSVTQ